MFNQFVCRKCNKRYIKEINYTKHVIRCRSAQDEKIPCGLCEKTFDSACAAKRHHEAHIALPFKCETCAAGFATKSHLVQHNRTHEIEINCPECGKVFQNKYTLKFHMRKHDPNYTAHVYKCRDCDYADISRRSYNRHRRAHTGQPDDLYVCDMCGKELRSKPSFDKHMRIHYNIKPYACKTCGKAFVCYDVCKTHERTHTNEKPFLCTLCGKAYTQRSSLRIHMRSHTGEKPYVCDICEKAFTSKAALSVHTKTHGRPI